MLVLNEEGYTKFLLEEVFYAKKFLWILTSDIKSVYVPASKGKFKPILEVFSDLVEKGVYIRLVHAKEPGNNFRTDFDRYPALLDQDLFDRVLCPRNHMKVIIVDGKIGYTGSANLTGAGIGAKSANKRNFEAGYITKGKNDLERLMTFIDELYLGDYCGSCLRREYCPQPLDGR